METRIENVEICKKCGGRCCRHMASHIGPCEIIKKFGSLTKEVIMELLYTGKVGIDWYDGDIREDDENIPNCELYDEIFYLRMRHKHEPVICPSWGGRCICLTDTGCSLSYENRPLGCQSLVPESNFRCSKTSYPKTDCIRDWIPYQELMSDIYENVSEQFREYNYKGGKC